MRIEANLNLFCFLYRDVLNRSMVQASPGGISGDSESDNKLTLINGEVILLPQVL